MTPFAMLYAVAVGVPIAWAAVAFAAVLRRYGRPERGVWLAGLVLSLVVPALALLGRATHVASAGEALDPTNQVGVIGLPEFVVVPAPQTSLDWGTIALAVWLIASVVLALRWVIAAYRLSRAGRSWAPATIDGVPVRLTGDVGPAVVGTFRPRVLAPAWLNDLPAQERALVLMHEEEHIRARDPLVIALTRTACVLVPWNPVLWLLAARLVRAVELDCDRRVLNRTSDVLTYGRTLLTVSKRRPGRLVAVAAFAESEAPLRNRILSMTTPPRNISIAAIAASTALGVLLFVGACEVPVPTESPEPAAAPVVDQTPSVTALDTPPTPPAPAEPTTTIEAPASAVRQGTTTRAPEAVAPAPTSSPVTTAAVPSSPQSSEPAFTPMTVRPQLTNAEALGQTLLDEYPPLLRDAGIGGGPVLWLHINTSGDVDDTRVYQSSGYEALDEGAQRVARAMRFTPAQDRDALIDVWVQVPIRFQAAN